MFNVSIGLDSIVAQTYDYVIAGGGTAGLVLANRLTENPLVKVAVIEAGKDTTEDPIVIVPGLGLAQLEDPNYDWNYITVPQKHAANKKMAHPRGKQLGGSSAINVRYQTHASQADINDWGNLGNEGWSWRELAPYFFKSENFTDPLPKQAEDLDIKPSNYDPALHGRNGPIHAGFPRSYTNLTKAWPRTLEGLGIPTNGDPRGGVALGGFSNPVLHDVIKAERSYAGNAYWKPVSNRPNLVTVTGALVSKVIFDKRKNQKDDLRATGLEFNVNGTHHIIKASKEVILSAGSFGSPQILELSGIGQKKLLSKLGVEVLLENHHVGENLQDHAFTGLVFEVKESETTLDALGDPVYFDQVLAEYHANRSGPLASTGSSSGLFSQAQISKLVSLPELNLSSVITSTEKAHYSGRAEQYALTIRKILDPHEAVAQLVPFYGGVNNTNLASSLAFFHGATGKDHRATIFGALEHPFSRGTVHITSTDPTVYSEVDPRYLSHPLDIKIFSGIMLFAQRVMRAEPVASLLKNGGTVYAPDFEELTPKNVERFIRNNVYSEYHPVGTCSMLPKDKGGVVTPRLKVYGTSNLRVVDASIFPLHVRANPTSLVYAVAEKAADIIKADAARA